VQLVRSAGAACRIVELIEAAEASAASGGATSCAPLELPEPSAQGPYLKARGLAVGWPGGPVVAEGIDLDLRPGRVQALVGESGSGKSVTALGALGLLPPTATVTGSARVIDPGARRVHQHGGEIVVGQRDLLLAQAPEAAFALHGLCVLLGRQACDAHVGPCVGLNVPLRGLHRGFGHFGGQHLTEMP